VDISVSSRPVPGLLRSIELVPLPFFAVAYQRPPAIPASRDKVAFNNSSLSSTTFRVHDLKTQVPQSIAKTSGGFPRNSSDGLCPVLFFLLSRSFAAPM